MNTMTAKLNIAENTETYFIFGKKESLSYIPKIDHE